MKVLLREHIVKRFGKVPPNLERVLDSFKEIQFKKNEVVLKEGTICNSIYFVADGCLQINGLNENGNISILGFVFEDNWYTAMDSFQNGSKSKQTIIATENTNLLSISTSEFKTIKSSIPEFEHVYGKVLEESYNEFMERIDILMTKDATERLIWFTNKHPNIFNRLNSKTIAQYLKVTPETLTRLKPKLFNS